MSAKKNDSPPNTKLNNLLEHYQNGRYVDAEKLALSITRKFPKHQFSWKVLGALYAQTGRKSEALKANKKSVELLPQDAAAHSNLGVNLQELGRLDEAEASCRQAITLKPDFYEAFYNLGNTLKAMDRLEEAETNYRQAIALKPDYYEAHGNLGITLKELGRLEEGEASCRQAIVLKPDFATAHNNLGATLQELGRLEEGEASCRQAIALQPGYAKAHFNLGVSLHDQDRLLEAERSYRQAIELQPDFADAFYNMGNTIRELGRLEEAETSYRKALKINPDHSEARHLVASLTGETPSSAPRVYVEKLFDGYASKFDSSLVGHLEYKTPKVIAQILLKKSSDNSLGSVLDLGCGTGLAGVEIRKYCDSLEGVDLSNLMLKKADKKNVYDKLSHKDITDYLSEEDLNFDCFISSDVFIYVGDLSEVFRLIKSRNRSEGRLVFTTEHTDKEGFFLQKTGRYSHSKKYIESLCAEFNYTLFHFETVNLRKEKDRFIDGGLYLLDF